MRWLGDSSQGCQAWTAVGLSPRYPRWESETSSRLTLVLNWIHLFLSCSLSSSICFRRWAFFCAFFFFHSRWAIDRSFLPHMTGHHITKTTPLQATPTPQRVKSHNQSLTLSPITFTQNNEVQKTQRRLIHINHVAVQRLLLNLKLHKHQRYMVKNTSQEFQNLRVIYHRIKHKVGRTTRSKYFENSKVSCHLGTGPTGNRSLWSVVPKTIPQNQAQNQSDGDTVIRKFQDGRFDDVINDIIRSGSVRII